MDIGKVVKVHPRREHTAPVVEPEPQIISVPERPSERAARRRKLWEGSLSEPQTEPVKIPVKVPAGGE